MENTMTTTDTDEITSIEIATDDQDWSEAPSEAPDDDVEEGEPPDLEGLLELAGCLEQRCALGVAYSREQKRLAFRHEDRRGVSPLVLRVERPSDLNLPVSREAYLAWAEKAHEIPAEPRKRRPSRKKR